MGSNPATAPAWPAWDEPGFYDQEPAVIHAAMAEQRREAPIYWYEPGEFWVLSKEGRQRYVSSHPELFTSRYAQAEIKRPGISRPRRRPPRSVRITTLIRSSGVIYVVALIGGGSDTSKHLMAFLAQALAERPEQREILLERPELIPNAMEEALRFYPIVWSECRTAVERVEIGGQTIDKDDFIVMSYSSANRGEEVWEGTCVDACPEVFALGDDDDVVTVLDAEPDEALRQLVEEAAYVCPKVAIRVD